jgi:anti-sigma factor ChrR (cupin superfamily)
MLSMYVVDLPAGAALGDSSHTHDGAESCLVLAGQVQADQAGAWVALAAGDAVTWTPGQRHRFINPGPGPARLLVSLAAPATLGPALASATHLQAPEDRQPVERPLRLVQMRAARKSASTRRPSQRSG